jgi:hypothetical protein
MVPLTPEEIAKRRQKLADLDISDESKDELILLLDSIAISLVYQCMGLHPVQLSLSARANYAFLGTSEYDNLPESERFELVDLPHDMQGEGAENDKSPPSSTEGQIAPR